MTHRSIVKAVFLLSCGSALAPLAVEGAKPDPARDAVGNVLRCEASTRVDRRAELAAELVRQPDSPLLRWQSGYVRDGKTWRAFERPSQPTPDDDKLAKYRDRRDQAPPSAEGQLELANWCRLNRLRDQERAHLFAVVNLSSDQEIAPVLERLGYRRLGSRWCSREQLLEWSEQNRRAQAALTQRGAQLEKIAEQLTGFSKPRDVVLANLKNLTSPVTIPAIEYVLCGRDETCARCAVEAFRTIEEYEGTLALAKQAVFSKWPSVREQAREALKTRPFEDFVPQLNQLLATPATLAYSGPQSHYWRDGPGLYGPGAFILMSSYLLARETDDQFQVAVLNTVDYRLNEQLRFIYVDTGTLEGDAPSHVLKTTLLRQQVDFIREADAAAREAEKQLAAMNERTADLNRRIVDVLAAVSGKDANADPRVWWKWWEEYTDTSRIGEKPIASVTEYETRGDSTARVVPTVTPQSSSCFAAGTPVWTDRGPEPIERIATGDRVLSQDVDTGELAYKPVLFTSIRQPRELFRVKFGDESVTATGGHRFWVSGKGWTKARDLKPESLLHTATANTSIRSLDPATVEAAYNLVVADFHTYFVGTAGILVQDLPLPRSTNKVIPGLEHTPVGVRDK